MSDDEYREMPLSVRTKAAKDEIDRIIRGMLAAMAVSGALIILAFIIGALVR